MSESTSQQPQEAEEAGPSPEKFDTWDATSVHDELITPLVLEIVRICEEHHIPHLMVFAQQATDNGVMSCVSCGNMGRDTPFTDNLEAALYSLHHAPPPFLVMTMRAMRIAEEEEERLKSSQGPADSPAATTDQAD